MVERKTNRPVRKSVQRKTPHVAAVAVSSVAIALVVGGFGFGLASADNGLGGIEEFGLAQYSSAVSPVGQLSNTNTTAASAKSSGFDVSAAATQAEKDHADKVAAEEKAAREAEVACRERAEAAKAEWYAQSDRPTNFEDVDWSVSRSEFIATWSARIDAFLEGSNLAGYGEVFAEQAWENGVDPRFSPAISATESGRGEVCFLPHNAWGWGSSSWGSWDEAIPAHVAGLAAGYGYSLTMSDAMVYCPPNYANWYAMVQSQIELI